MAEIGFWNLAQQAPEKLALADPGGREWSRGELLASGNKIAHGLRALGLGRGDCVAVVLENCAEMYQINLAITLNYGGGKGVTGVTQLLIHVCGLQKLLMYILK